MLVEPGGIDFLSEKCSSFTTVTRKATRMHLVLGEGAAGPHRPQRLGIVLGRHALISPTAHPDVEPWTLTAPSKLFTGAAHCWAVWRASRITPSVARREDRDAAFVDAVLVASALAAAVGLSLKASRPRGQAAQRQAISAEGSIRAGRLAARVPRSTCRAGRATLEPAGNQVIDLPG